MGGGVGWLAATTATSAAEFMLCTREEADEDRAQDEKHEDENKQDLGECGQRLSDNMRNALQKGLFRWLVLAFIRVRYILQQGGGLCASGHERVNGMRGNDYRPSSVDGRASLESAMVAVGNALAAALCALSSPRVGAVEVVVVGVDAARKQVALADAHRNEPLP